MVFFASMKQTKMANKNQRKIESTRRQWEIEDLGRERKLSALYRRLDQIEEFIGYVADDFHNLRHDAVFVLSTKDPNAIQARMESYIMWRDNLPKRVYAYGASVRSLENDQLVNSWEKIYEAFENMRDFYIKVYKDKGKDPESHPDVIKDQQTVDSLYDQFNEGLGLFISELDKIRAGSSIKEYH